LSNVLNICPLVFTHTGGHSYICTGDRNINQYLIDTNNE